MATAGNIFATGILFISRTFKDIPTINRPPMADISAITASTSRCLRPLAARVMIP